MRRPADNKSSDNHQHQLDHLPLSSCLRWNTSYSFSWADRAVQLGHYHGVADAHQDDGDEEHHNIHKGVVDLLGGLSLVNFLCDRITFKCCWEDVHARLGRPSISANVMLERIKSKSMSFCCVLSSSPLVQLFFCKKERVRPQMLQLSRQRQ